MADPNLEKLALMYSLADEFGFDVNSPGVTITTDKKSAKVKMYDDSLEATMVPSLEPTVYIEAPKTPGVLVRLVDHVKNPLAPEGAIYQIGSYAPDENGSEHMLNHDVDFVYVGKDGIIIDDSGRERISKLEKGE